MTDTERVIALLQVGLTERAIAAVLGVEIDTVHSHVIEAVGADPLPLGPNAPAGGGGGGAGPWRTFTHTGPGPQTWWNGWHDTGDSPALFRDNGGTIEMQGTATGGVANPANAIVAFPADIVPPGDVYFPDADLRVHLITGVAYLVVIDGTSDPYDLSVVTFTRA